MPKDDDYQDQRVKTAEAIASINQTLKDIKDEFKEMKEDRKTMWICLNEQKTIVKVLETKMAFIAIVAGGIVSIGVNYVKGYFGKE